MLDDLQRKVALFDQQHKGGKDFEGQFHINDTLLVPNMRWKIRHRFEELAGQDKVLVNAPLAGLYIDEASQVLQFQLDRSGAELTSEAAVVAKLSPQEYHFDRPFLLYMKKRGAARPFLVMWIENAELLQKW